MRINFNSLVRFMNCKQMSILPWYEVSLLSMSLFFNWWVLVKDCVSGLVPNVWPVVSLTHLVTWTNVWTRDQWQQTLSSWQPAAPASIRSNIFSGQCEIFSCADLDLGMGMMMSTADVYVLPVLQTVTMTMVLDHDTSVSMVTRELLSPHSSTAVMVTDIPTLECRAPVSVPPPTSVSQVCIR